MRLWSLHPKHLDSKGLVALWREGLLAQNVLLGKTKGYKNHPQLNRFKATEKPELAIAVYLHAVVDEADARGYNFNREKIIFNGHCDNISVTSGQLAYELKHLLAKLSVRDPQRHISLSALKQVELHPLLTEVEGDIEDWEIVTL